MRQRDTQGEDAPENLTIVGIGASAGGLEALERFFKTMPVDSGLAFVVIQHLSPDFKSLMDELLARHTTMPIHRVEDGMTVEANSIYLIPPKKEMIISGGRLLLTDKDPDQDLSLPIDHFFRSLAQDAGPLAVAIVLSGTGSDGSRGIRDVHEAGGLVIAQDGDSAKFDGMPKSARETGIVDIVLQPEDMPQALIDYVNRSVSRVPGSSAVESVPEYGVEAIFQLLRNEYGIDFSYYKPNTVSRRIERRLSLNQSVDLDDYVDRLRTDAGELNSLYRDLLIGVTRFFRDREAFNRLENDLLLDLLVRKRADEELRVWVAGCATGEEAYSIAILIHERLESLKRPANVKIFATDVHHSSLETASLGVYDAEVLSHVNAQRLDRYFTRQNDGYHVNPELRKMIVFARHNVIKDTPFTKLDMITCRNLLIYFQPPAQKKILSLFHFGLKTGGLLFLGSSESPGELGPEFQTLDERWKIYRKRRDIRLPADLRLNVTSPATKVRMPGLLGSTTSGFDAPLLLAYDKLLEDYMPPGFLVNDQRQLVHTFGGAARFIRQGDGRPKSDILDLVDGDLRLALAGALQRATKGPGPVAYSGVRLKTGEGEESFRLTVKPIANRLSNLTHLFIALESLGTKQNASNTEIRMNDDEVSREHVDSLETELRYTRENLQSTVEELETSNEELQATNEELVASNEELQSTNEELQSVNEELYTVNAEYQKKISELTEMTDDMDNLLRSTDIGTIFLDRQYCIRKFTPQIGRVFNLLPQDIGRRIDTFSHSIRNEELLDKVTSVLETGSPIEKEVQDRSSNWYFLRILPYRSHGRIEGVVLTLIPISLLKQAEETKSRLAAIVESSDDAIIGKDLDSTITNWNHGAERLFGYTAAEVIGKPITILMPPDRMDEEAAIMAKIRHGQPISHFETVRRRKDGTPVYISLSVSPITDGQGRVIGVSKIARDVSERKRAEEETARHTAQLESANRELQEHVARRRDAEKVANDALRRRDEFLAMLSHELRNPLAAVLNAAQLLDRDSLDRAMLKDACGTIQRQSRLMSRLLDDLLDVSRFTRDKIEIRRERVDLRATAQEAIAAVNSLIARKALRLATNIPDEPLWVDGDPARLQQIQVNLLSNAIKYTPDGGQIWFRLEEESERAVIRVRDNGIGIDPALHEKIFELFVQADRPRLADSGMGVGLTLVRALVQLHQGTVEVHSAGEGKGSEFVVRLPLCQPDTLKEQNPVAAATLSGLRIVLIEDHADIRAITGLLLESQGAEVHLAEDGPAGIEAIRTHQPDIALVDIGMPSMDGYDVARAVRGLRSIPQPLLVAITGFGQAKDREQALQVGFDAHMIKPIDLEDLMRVLGKLRNAP